MKWTKGKTKKQISDEIDRISHIVITQGDVVFEQNNIKSTVYEVVK